MFKIAPEVYETDKEKEKFLVSLLNIPSFDVVLITFDDEQLRET